MDDLKEPEYLDIIHKFLHIAFKTINNGFIFLNIGYNAKSRGTYIKAIAPFADSLWETAIWKKTGMPVSNGLTRNHEFIFIFGIGNHGHINEEFQTTHSVWEIPNQGAQDKETHRACFPIALPTKAIDLVTKENQICLDPFLGSGTTLIACEQLDRICYGMEISPQYCEVICQRWEKLTGEKRLKINGVDATT